jgi:hypothetical protein
MIIRALFVLLVFITLGNSCEEKNIENSTDYVDPYPSDLENRYIVFFLTNTSIDQADNQNSGKDADSRYSFVGELPQIFGTIEKDKPYKYAYGIPGPMLLTQSTDEMQYQINKAFDIAEKYNVPVYFQLDDCNNYTTEFGQGATPKYYENPEWCEWTSFLKINEEWGGQLNGRLPYFWFNWGSWMHAKAFPCFQSQGFRDFVSNQLKKGVLDPLKKRYEKLCNEEREYLFAGIAVGWETHIPDYSTRNSILNVNPQNLPVNILAGDQMRIWEASEYGYNSLSLLGYKEYNLQALYKVIHDYTEMMAKTVYESGIPKVKIFTHTVGFMSLSTYLQTTFAPPIWAAVNGYSIPGFTLSPVTCRYDLVTLKSEISKADKNQTHYACAEGYGRGVDGKFDQADSYFDSLFGKGAALVTVFGWGREPSISNFAVSHSKNSPFVLAAKKWLKMGTSAKE